MFRTSIQRRRVVTSASALILLIWTTGPVRAQTALIAFDISGHNGSSEPAAATTVKPSPRRMQISHAGPNLLLQSRANSFVRDNRPTAASPVTAQDYFTFTIAPVAGFQTTLTGPSLDAPVDTSGPTQFVVRTGLDNFAGDVGAPFLPPADSPTPDALDAGAFAQGLGRPGTLTSPIDFRLYDYGAARTDKELWPECTSGSPDAIPPSVTVTSVPEPTALLALGGGGLLMGVWWLCHSAATRWRSARLPS